MATIASRLSNTGTLLVNGSIDEVTFNTGTPAIKNIPNYSESYGAGFFWSTAGVTVTNNSIIAPDGSLTAAKITEDTSVNSIHRLLGNNNFVAGTTYTLSVFIKAAERTKFVFFHEEGASANRAGLILDLVAGTKTNYITGTGTVTSSTMTLLNNGWYRVSFTFTAAATALVNITFRLIDNLGNLTYTGDGVSGLYIWGIQFEASSSPTIYQGRGATGVILTPRFKTKTDINSVYSTGGYDEVTYSSTTPAIKNLLRYTEQLDNISYWFQGTSATVSTNTITAPNDSLTADKIIQTTTNARHGLQSPTIVVSANTAYTLSCFAKAAENNFIHIVYGKSGSPSTRGGMAVNLTTGTVTNYTIGSPTSVVRGTPINVGNGWWFIYLTVVIDASSTDGYVEINTLNSIANINGYTGANGTDGTYVWGAQLEVGNTPTIYQGIAAENTLVAPGFAKREDAGGNLYVTGSFDEFTGAPVVDSSLIKWLDAGQQASLNSASLTWNDLSGYSSHATLTSGTTYSSGDGGSIAFNGTSLMNMASVAIYPATFADPWTTEVWIYIPSSVTWGTISRTGIFQKGSFGGVHGLAFTTTNNQIAVLVRGSGSGSSNSFGNINRDAWYHVVGSWSGTTTGSRLKLYINGVLAQATTPTIVGSPSGTIWIIGSNTVEGQPGGNYFNGNISAAKLYNRELTEDEVSQNFNALRRRYNV